jgi:nitronate monooxygenase
MRQPAAIENNVEEVSRPLKPDLRSGLTLPVICAPMFTISGTELVREVCKAGLIGALPRANARDLAQFGQWLGAIRRDLRAHALRHSAARIGPVAVSLSTRMVSAELAANLEVCARHDVNLIISASGDPTELVKRVHDQGALIFHDVTNLRFASKAISAGVDGLIAIGAGAGGQSGTMSPFALIPQLRSTFGGTIVAAGGIATGAGIRAAEVLGADLVYLGTRFIATRESEAAPDYKELLMCSSSADLIYTDRITGVPTSWLAPSLRRVGLAPEDLPARRSADARDRSHLPPGARPWKSIWSAGHGIDLIHDAPSVAELVGRLRGEYAAACNVPHVADLVASCTVLQAESVAPADGSPRAAARSSKTRAPS